MIVLSDVAVVFFLFQTMLLASHFVCRRITRAFLSFYVLMCELRLKYVVSKNRVASQKLESKRGVGGDVIGDNKGRSRDN